MDSQVSELIAEAVPQIVITEPSPASQKGSVVVPVADKAVPTAECSGVVPMADKAVPITEQYAEIPQAVPVPAETNGPNSSDSSDVEVISEEFTSAQECAECTVPVPEIHSTYQVQPPISSASSETDQDDFRIPTGTSLYGSCLSCLACYEGICNRIPYRWRIPLWLILFGLPLSAGVMSSLYMLNCPAAINLPHSVFITAIAGVALVTARLCTILHKITGDEEGETKQNLRILLLIATFVFLLFFFLESLIYWQVDWTSRIGARNYCDPTLMNFLFVWNIVTYVALVPILFFPA